ncbi:MAG TPA: NADH-quinone oxidoreductase subunit H [Candidatus Limnocylindria bacterium]|nr:NADH-quinone oxidoreductase subunit H [Candidatus Limnocylindria bacterium]
MTDLVATVGQSLLQLALLVALAPALSGLVKTTKAWLQGRTGPPLWQPYADLVKLLRKDMVVPEHASWVFRWAPAASAAAISVAALLVPAAGRAAPLSLWGDAIAFVGLFALARFVLALAALDTASAFGGIGASREVAVAALAEPALLLGLFAVAMRTGTTDLSAMSDWIATHGSAAIAPSQILAFVALAIVVITETGRVPVDNPDTHLELTMLHEGMLLEYSGRALGIVLWSTQLKQIALFALLVALFAPGAAPSGPAESALAVATSFAKIAVLGLAVALVESANAKLRILRLPELLGTASALAALALVTELLLP